MDPMVNGRPSQQGWRKYLPYVLIGVGLTILIVGAVVGGLGLGDNDIIDSSHNYKAMAICGMILASIGSALTSWGCHIICAPLCKKEQPPQTNPDGTVMSGHAGMTAGYVPMASVDPHDATSPLPDKQLDKPEANGSQKMPLTHTISQDTREESPSGMGSSGGARGGGGGTLQWGEMWSGGGEMWSTGGGGSLNV